MDINLDIKAFKKSNSTQTYRMILLNNKPPKPTDKKIKKRWVVLSKTLKLKERFNVKLVDMPTNTLMQLDIR